MQRYWFAGNNFDFLYLLTLVDRARIMAAVNATTEGEDVGTETKEEAQQYWEASAEFFHSFQTKAGKLWDLLTGPYRKLNKIEMKEWIADEIDDDADDEEERGSHRTLFMDSIRKTDAIEAEADRELVDRLENAVRKHNDGKDDDEEEEDDEEYALAESKDDDSRDEYDDNSESEDDWEQNILNKRRARSPKDKKKPPRGPPRKRGGDDTQRKLRPKYRVADNKQQEEESDDLESWQSEDKVESAGQSRRGSFGKARRVIDDDDDDEENGKKGMNDDTLCFV